MKTNMKYLWTWYDFIELGIPNTNNALEDYFTHLRSKLKVHNGMNIRQREIFIDKYLAKEYER